MMHTTCQVCGNSMFSQSYCGTDAKGALTAEYCSNCYKGGQFYNRDWDGYSSNVPGAAIGWPFAFDNSRVGGGFGG